MMWCGHKGSFAFALAQPLVAVWETPNDLHHPAGGEEVAVKRTCAKCKSWLRVLHGTFGASGVWFLGFVHTERRVVGRLHHSIALCHGVQSHVRASDVGVLACAI